MTYKMVCIDMDGTLLGKGKKISEKSKEVIKKIHDKGVEIVVTTGRIYNNAAYYSHILGVESPVIAANGAIVRNKHNNEVIYENPIKTDVCMKLVDLLYKNDFLFHFYTLDGIYCGNRITKLATKIYMTKQVGYENLKIKYHIIKNIEEWKLFFKNANAKITKCIAFSINPDKIPKTRRLR